MGGIGDWLWMEDVAGKEKEKDVWVQKWNRLFFCYYSGLLKGGG